MPQEYILKGVVNAAVGQVISVMKNNMLKMTVKMKASQEIVAWTTPMSGL